MRLNFRKKSAAKREKPFSKRFTRSRFGNFMYFFFLTAAGLFSVLPLIYAVTTSFKPIDELLIFPPTFFVKRPTAVNYITVIYIIISAMAAFVLSKATFRGRNLIFMIIQFALMFNAYTLAVPQYLIVSGMKIIDSYWVYILPQLAATLGVFLMKQYIEGYVPDALLEAASIDGAGYYRIFWQIVMPVIRPAWLTVTLFSFRDVWAAIPNGTIFSERLKTLPQIVTQITAGGIARTGSAMAVTVIMMIPPIFVYLVSQSNVVEAMSSAGIKG